MELLGRETNFNFMGQRKVAMVVSALLITAAVASLAMRSLNFGLDFTGGTLIEVEYEQAEDLGAIRTSLTDAGFDNFQVTTFGSTRDIVVRIAPKEGETNAKLSEDVLSALESGARSPLELRRVEFVGPQVGDELTEKGALAMIYALIGILIYIIIRFHWKFSVGAVAALIHDVIIVMGVFSWLQLDFDLTVLAALLAVIGYSLNDTIVVYDRVRENLRGMRKGTSLEILNRSINQMLSRTLMTSLTTLMVLLALFFLGGEIIHGFATALIIGVLVGTYSSIYVACTVALYFGLSKQDLVVVQKEGAGANSGAQV